MRVWFLVGTLMFLGCGADTTSVHGNDLAAPADLAASAGADLAASAGADLAASAGADLAVPDLGARDLAGAVTPADLTPSYDAGDCTGVVCTAMDECHDVGTCDPYTGICSNPLKARGASCTSGTCDGAGSCVALPTVASTTPADGDSGIDASTTIAITFSEAMDPTTLTAQTAGGSCSGTVQVSLDGFASCVAMAAASPTMSNGNTTATFRPQPGLLVNWTFKVRVTTGALDPAGGGPASSYTQLTGFATTSPTGTNVQNEGGGATEANYCVTQYPKLLTVATGMDSGLIFGRLYQAGETPSGGSKANLKAQLGWGPMTANPEYEAGWTWIDATYNASCSGCGNNDEYMASFTAPAAGTYWYVYRMSVDGGTSWTYCDKDGDGSNSVLTPFTFDQIAVLTVTP